MVFTHPEGLGESIHPKLLGNISKLYYGRFLNGIK